MSIGTWDDIFAPHAADVQAIAHGLRGLVLRLHPETVAVARPGDNAVTFGTGPRKMLDGYLYLAPHKSRVNLGFFQGAVLVDPAGLQEGTGKSLRHIKITSPAMTALPAVADLIAQAIDLQRDIEKARQ